MNISKSLKHGAGIATVLATVAFATACTDDIELGDSFVDKAPGGSVNADTIFSNAIYTDQFLTGIYSLQYYGLPYNNYSTTANSQNHYTGKFDAVTDLYSLHWSSTTVWNAYYLGSLSANATPLFAFLNDKVWEAVRYCNMLIQNIDRVPGLDDDTKKRMVAEAKCLKASRYFDLFVHYGGLPLIDEVYTGGETSFDIPRATLAETVDYIVKLLDEAEPDLEWAFNGNTATTNSTNVGRWTAAGAMALKAKLLTFAASPIFNSEQPYCGGASEAEQQHIVWYGDYSASRWERALTACREFFERLAADGYYALVQANGTTVNDYRLAYRQGYALQGSTELLHQTRVRDYDNWANGYYAWSNWVNLGRNSYCPTWEYMCMYPWSDGTYFDWQADSTKIYGTSRRNRSDARLFYRYTANSNIKSPSRDPRLYENMIVNGQDATMDWTTGVTSGDEYELWVGGEHAGFNVLNETLVTKFATGFGVMKYHMGTEYQRLPLLWGYLSLDEMYLMYAECLAQTGNLSAAIDQVDIIRSRVGLNSLRTGSQYASTIATNKDDLIEEILRERACELGMSNNRYFDMCRYKRTDWMTKQLHGLLTYRIQLNSNGTWSRIERPYIGDEKNAGNYHPTLFEYEVFELHQPQQRAWWAYADDQNNTNLLKWLLSPLPQSEINKNYGLVQNPGW